MRARTSLLLAVLGVVLLALGLVYGTGPAERMDAAPGGQLAFPGLAAQLGRVTRVELLHGGATLVIARRDDAPDAAWGLPDHGYYPVQPGKLRALLTGLTELRLDAPRTSAPADYPRLGVEDPRGKDAQSTLLRLLDGQGDTVAALILGHAGSAADTLYVRRPAEAQSWVAAGHLDARTDALDWLDRNVITVPAADIASVAVTRSGQTLRFARQGDKLALIEPADHPKLDDYKIGEIAGALDGLTFEDVRPAPALGESLGRSVFVTADGTSVTVEISKAGADIWAMLSAGDKDAARLQGWAYRLGAWKEQALLPTLDGLKAAEPPTPPAAGK